jgi:hypothetical protein
MNWYNKFIVSFRNPLDTDAIQICPKIFSDVRSLALSGSLRSQTLSYDIIKVLKEQDRAKYKNAKVTINVSIDVYGGALSYGEFDIGGLTLDYGTEKQDIEVDAKITKSFNSNNFRNFYMLLFDVIRHELQHVLDNINKRYDDNHNKDDSYGGLVDQIRLLSEKILSERELGSYIRGWMLQAKRERKSFIEIAKNSIEVSFYGKDKKLFMKHPSYLLLSKIEENTIAKVIQEAQKIYKRVR